MDLEGLLERVVDAMIQVIVLRVVSLGQALTLKLLEALIRQDCLV